MLLFHGSLSSKALLNTTRRFETCLPASFNGFIQSPWYSAAPGQSHGPVWGSARSWKLTMMTRELSNQLPISCERDNHCRRTLSPDIQTRNILLKRLSYAWHLSRRSHLLVYALATRERLQVSNSSALVLRHPRTGAYRIVLDPQERR